MQLLTVPCFLLIVAAVGIKADVQLVENGNLDVLRPENPH
jgi:hypothetical protein